MLQTINCQMQKHVLLPNTETTERILQHDSHRKKNKKQPTVYKAFHNHTALTAKLHKMFLSILNKKNYKNTFNGHCSAKTFRGQSPHIFSMPYFNNPQF